MEKEKGVGDQGESKGKEVLKEKEVEECKEIETKREERRERKREREREREREIAILRGGQTICCSIYYA